MFLDNRTSGHVTYLNMKLSKMSTEEHNFDYNTLIGHDVSDFQKTGEAEPLEVKE